MRLDKWLWQARFFRTRTLATGIVAKGAVRVNGRKAQKPASPVGAGDTLTFVQGDAVRVIRVLGLPGRRGPASEAAELYEDVNPA